MHCGNIILDSVKTISYFMYFVHDRKSSIWLDVIISCRQGLRHHNILSMLPLLLITYWSCRSDELLTLMLQRNITLTDKTLFICNCPSSTILTLIYHDIGCKLHLRPCFELMYIIFIMTSCFDHTQDLCGSPVLLLFIR